MKTIYLPFVYHWDKGETPKDAYPRKAFTSSEKADDEVWKAGHGWVCKVELIED